MSLYWTPGRGGRGRGRGKGGRGMIRGGKMRSRGRGRGDMGHDDDNNGDVDNGVWSYLLVSNECTVLQLCFHFQVLLSFTPSKL